MAGVCGFSGKEVEELAGGSVRLTGWMPREHVYELFRGARGFIYPSTFEGFGMPVLEAMAAGVPVACSDIPPLREVAGSTVHYFDPASETAVRDALERLVAGSISTEAAAPRAAGVTLKETGKATPRHLGQQLEL